MEIFLCWPSEELNHEEKNEPHAFCHAVNKLQKRMQAIEFGSPSNGNTACRLSGIDSEILTTKKGCIGFCLRHGLLPSSNFPQHMDLGANKVGVFDLQVCAATEKNYANSNSLFSAPNQHLIVWFVMCAHPKAGG